ncbi:MAG: kynureninase [Gemmatimonadota bacterium]|nr:kynureninase [Gemmatimonadota bacterium]
MHVQHEKRADLERSGVRRTAEAFRTSPNPIADRYSRFRVSERLLLTGHSHQAWPDAAFEGQQQAWLDAAEWVDDKWVRVAEQSERVADGYRRLMGGVSGDLALDANTHALVVRFLSALPLRGRPRVVTTDAEFHTIRRQLDRLAEEGIEVVKVPAAPVDSLAERLADRIDDRTACAMLSSVLYASGLVVPGLPVVADACLRHGAELLVDAYHQLNVVPFDPAGLERAFIVGGGYKYCQMGEGVCVMRIPEGCRLRPVVTGWFSEFGDVAVSPPRVEVPYGAGAARFAGSTFDPTSHYRAARVFRFFEEEELDVPLLRAVNRHQVDLLVDTFRGIDADPSVVSLDEDVDGASRGGFLALRAPEAAALSEALAVRGVRTDVRGDVLRFGPAPYLSDQQVRAAMEALGEVLREDVTPG